MNDKYLLPLFVSGTILLVLFVFFIIAYLLVQKQKQNAYQLEKSRLIYNHQNKLLHVRIEEQERSMDQVSKEIHDNVGQLLNLTKMNMHPIAKRATDPDQRTLIDNTRALIDQLINEVRSISHSLNTDYIKANGIVSVLEEETRFIMNSHDIRCQVNLSGDNKAFDPEQELFIYRIAQEAIHNVIKHAHASELTIDLTYEPELFTMSITDNGKGFELNEIYELKGIGFLNMMQRAKLLNASLDIQSQPSKGCTITLTMKKAHKALPIDEDMLTGA
jgi:two-component system, NarL family, sensor kinase